MKPSFQGLSDAELDICLKQAIDEDVSAGPPVDLEVLWARIDTEKRTVAAPIRKSRRQRSDFRKQTMVPLAAGLAIAVASVAGGVGIVSLLQDEEPEKVPSPAESGVSFPSPSSPILRPPSSSTSVPVIPAPSPCAQSMDPQCGPLTWSGAAPLNEPMQIEVRATGEGLLAGQVLVRFDYRGSDVGGGVNWEMARYSGGRWQANATNKWKADSGCATPSAPAFGTWTPDEAAKRNEGEPADPAIWQTMVFRPKELRYQEVRNEYFPVGDHTARLLFYSNTCGPFDEFFASQRELTVAFTANADGSITNVSVSG
ncbi:MAG: hypothetical protein WBD02_02130 [Acidimicrobiia bacterium]